MFDGERRRWLAEGGVAAGAAAARHSAVRGGKRIDGRVTEWYGQAGARVRGRASSGQYLGRNRGIWDT